MRFYSVPVLIAMVLLASLSTLGIVSLALNEVSHASHPSARP